MFWSLIKNKFVGHNKSNAKDRYMDSFGGGFSKQFALIGILTFCRPTDYVRQ